MNLLDQLKYQFKQGGMYIKLMYINVGIFIFFGLFTTLFELMMFKLQIDTFKNVLILYTKPYDLFTHPWGIISYMFLHHNFGHLFWNMLILFFVGRLFEDSLGPKKMLSTYIIGGIFGALIQIIATNSFPLLSSNGYPVVLGASASVMAVFSAIAFYNPNREVYLFGTFKIKLIAIALVYILLDFLRLSNQDNVAHFAHLGGALWGYIFIANFKKGKDFSKRFDKWMSFLKGIFKRNKIKIVYSKGKKTTPKRTKSDYNYNEDKNNRQKKVDAILDKIKDSGYESLSKEEKDYLFDASKNI